MCITDSVQSMRNKTGEGRGGREDSETRVFTENQRALADRRMKMIHLPIKSETFLRIHFGNSSEAVPRESQQTVVRNLPSLSLSPIFSFTNLDTIARLSVPCVVALLRPAYLARMKLTPTARYFLFAFPGLSLPLSPPSVWVTRVT